MLDNKCDLQFKNFLNIQDLLRSIDQKAVAILAVYGFMITLFVRMLSEFSVINLPATAGRNVLYWYYAGLFTGVLFFANSISQVYIILFKVLKPSPAKHYPDGKHSLFYWGHIKDLDKDVYFKELNEATEDHCMYEIALQIHEISCILSKKTKNLIIAYYFFFASVILLMLFSLVKIFPDLYGQVGKL